VCPNDETLDPDLVAAYQAMAAELPPLTDEQLDALCDVLAAVRLDAAKAQG
jgi:hypothetical protein